MPDDRVTEEELARLAELFAPYQGRPTIEKSVERARACMEWMPRLIAEVRRLREEIEHGDYWQKRATEAAENGTCPICFAIDDDDHKDWCDWGKAEREVERLKGGGK